MFIFDVADPVSVTGGALEGLWLFLPVGYAATVMVELPLLLLLLPRSLGFKAKAACGFWLTACTYPVVVLVLPALMADFSREAYLLVAETFAPAAECVLFWLAFRGRDLLGSRAWVRSFLAVIFANLASFLLGEVMNAYVWYGLF